MAAKTWSGQWWLYGGGATVWNAIVYDPELDRVYIGTGNGSPWRGQIRSPEGGDNLFVASIIALDARTGSYIWHYQTTPGDNWDFDATTDIELASLRVNGVRHRVLMQASKNGFFYVIDRDFGKLISAKKFVYANWADRIDPATGRPIENVNARDEASQTAIWPRAFGGHGPQPMAFSPLTGLVYIPAVDGPVQHDRITDLCDRRSNLDMGAGFLVALDPVAQHEAWRASMPGVWNGGVLATAGNLVFQGRCDGRLVAYASDTGQEAWSFDAQVGIVGAPITYRAAGKQYLSVVAGYSGGLGAQWGSMWDARTQPRRVLTFAIDVDPRILPYSPRQLVVPVSDPDFHSNTDSEQMGEALFGNNCEVCHGTDAISGGAAPDLRASSLVLDSIGFQRVVREGALVERGMPRFEELSNQNLNDLRQYLRSRAARTGR